MKTPFFSVVLSVVRKDLRAELRTRELVNSMVLFALLSILIFSFALELDRNARRESISGVLWVTVAPIALLSFMYQNDGWVQFGFRFSLDYLMLPGLLLAIGGRPMTRTMRALILVGVAVNLFGAITFGRAWQFYHEGFFPISPGEL